MKGIYLYRGEVILKNKNTDRWLVTGLYDEYDTIDEAKNALDKKLGGWTGKTIPKRWLKDEILKKWYEDGFHSNQNGEARIETEGRASNENY